MPVIGNKEILFHRPQILKSVFSKEKIRTSGTPNQADNNSQRGSQPPLLHLQTANRRYHFFKMVSISPVGTSTPAALIDNAPDMVTNGAAGNAAVTHNEKVKSQKPHALGKASIRELTPNETVLALAQLKKNIMDRESAFNPEGSKEKAEEDGHSVQASVSASNEKSLKRLEETYNVIGFMQVLDYSDRKVYGSFVGDQPIGLMLLADYSSTYVSAIVTDPGSNGTGAALIERAVNESEASGSKGHLELTTSNANADKAFAALGFTASGINMALDPESSDKWTRQDDGQWRLKKYLDRK